MSTLTAASEENIATPTSSVSKKSLLKKEDDDDEYGTETVSLFVGPKRKQFVFHLKFLAAKVPVFDKMFNDGFKEAKEKCAYFPEDTPEGFASLSRWIYRGELPPATADSSKSSKFVNSYAVAFCLAEKYCIVELMDQAMDRIREEIILSNSCPSNKFIIFAYDNTDANSRLRLYMSRTLHAKITRTPVSGLSRSTKALLDTLNGHPDLGTDVVALMRNTSGKKILKPEAFPPCHYHQHYQFDEKSPCPYAEPNKITTS